ncbi:TPA: hypothetical protein PQC75_002574 [Staphylococcus aureus]|uniref:hypothetical protein n=1 Tax=Staphylococcus aureus TaxID=1280 RepID=UPI0009523D12|nr:hypothetical protein AUK68_03150 [Staphylococcus epidermidis]HCY8173567.1 hypothetical protein [Staphylococcus aureus]HDJ3742787.1 hypothetical protein [Staphylococcus aureus]
MLLDIIIDSDSIVYLFKEIFKYILIFILISPVLIGFYCSFINLMEYDNYETASKLSIFSGLLLVMYIGVYCISEYLFHFDLLFWLEYV